MGAYIIKEQHIPEDQQYEKSSMEHTKKQERVHTERNDIYILSDSSSSLSSDVLSEKSFDDSSDSGTRQKPTKPLSSYNK